MSSAQNPGWLFDIWDEILPNHMGIITSHYKDPVLKQPGFHGMSLVGFDHCSHVVFQRHICGWFKHLSANLVRSFTLTSFKMGPGSSCKWVISPISKVITPVPHLFSAIFFGVPQSHKPIYNWAILGPSCSPWTETCPPASSWHFTISHFCGIGFRGVVVVLGCPRTSWGIQVPFFR